jgi:TIR domain
MSRGADFFVSYTSEDQAWAEWIAWQLEGEGYQVVVQAWDIVPGRDWVHEMHQATALAERIVVVLSTAYLRSQHGEAEWRPYYAKDASGELGLLLPVRIDTVKPEGLLETRVYLDLVDRDAATARAALLAAARQQRGKPTGEPGFPGTHSRSRGPREGPPRFPGDPDSQVLNQAGVHRWAWPREDLNAQGRPTHHPQASPFNWPTPPPLDVVRSALVGWAYKQRGLSPKEFGGQLRARHLNAVRLDVDVAFDWRNETSIEQYPGPPQGHVETYDGSLQHALLSLDRGERRWQDVPRWSGVREGWRKWDCSYCAAEGKAKCDKCRGNGEIEVRPDGSCRNCGGQGLAGSYAITVTGETVYRNDICRICGGSGMPRPIKLRCLNPNCSDGRIDCPTCRGNKYLTSFFWGVLTRRAVSFELSVPEHHDLQRVQNRYELVRDSTGWPDMSDLSPDVRRGMETRLEETLTELRDRTLGANSLVYHLRTRLFALPVIQIPYDRGTKHAYLIGRHWEVFAPDEQRPEVRLKRAWDSTRRSLRTWLDQSRFRVQQGWPILTKGISSLIESSKLQLLSKWNVGAFLFMLFALIIAVIVFVVATSILK